MSQTLGVFADRWALDVFTLVNLLVLGAMYLWGVRVCRDTGDRWPVRNT